MSKSASSSQTPNSVMATLSSSSSIPKFHILDELSRSIHAVRRESACPAQTPIDQQTSWIVAETRQTVECLQRGSHFFENHPPKLVPTFQEDELQLGQIIGNGQFGMVFEVNGFHLQKTKTSNSILTATRSSNIRGEDDEFPKMLDRDDTKIYMRNDALRDGAPRFAVKRVRLDLMDEEKENSAIDLAVEATFLASIDHSNIIKLRGTVSQPGYDSFMIVLDRLYAILSKKIQQWQAEARAARGPFGLRMFKKVDDYKAKTERLVCMYDIARAFKHLHSMKILYRDLKPESIGCDVRGDYKIFDFGLSKELRKDLLREAPDGYDCTGLTGSRRWMAPEVCCCKLYGLSSDVYSYSLLFYYVVTLDLPYGKYDLKKQMKHVVLGGERPNGKKIKTCDKLQDTIIQGWCENPRKRPSMSTICDVIQEATIRRKQDIKKNKRRSTVAHILRRSQLLNERSELSMVEEEKGDGN
ncbi:serine/threonine protein kinase [Nitzschia inconspicua]|uniref:Serine/threonine protein kinase n=1 Tax=Nitzschia inconspicua TaxID=303405 RepID=A0A9K3LQ87_9STRA|nr:serine/threonine protein kinase [Nitzschia inconspicua]